MLNSIFKSIIKILFFLFPLFFWAYLSLVYIQGFKWHGFIQKHTGIPPISFFVLSIISGLATFIYLKQKGKRTTFYNWTVLLSRKLFRPLLIFSLLLLITNNPSLSLWVLDNLRFHWQRFINANLGLALGFASVILIDIFYPVSAEVALKFIKKIVRNEARNLGVFQKRVEVLLLRFFPLKIFLILLLFGLTYLVLLLSLPKLDVASAAATLVAVVITFSISTILSKEVSSDEYSRNF